MRSARGVLACTLFLLAIPLAALCQMLLGRGAETVVHVALALGAGLLASAARAFRTPRSVAWVGGVSMGALAVIFALQAVAELTRSAPLARVAFEVLGQNLEGMLHSLFLMWCVAVWLIESRGRSKALGVVALGPALAVRLSAYAVTVTGGSANDAPEALKLFYLLPFVWLLVEFRKAETRAS
jgi:hypothetical protein